MWSTSPQRNSRSRCWEMWLRCMANMKSARYVADFLFCSFSRACYMPDTALSPWGLQHSSPKPLGSGTGINLLLFWPDLCCLFWFDCLRDRWDVNFLFKPVVLNFAKVKITRGIKKKNTHAYLKSFKSRFLKSSLGNSNAQSRLKTTDLNSGFRHLIVLHNCINCMHLEGPWIWDF